MKKGQRLRCFKNLHSNFVDGHAVFLNIFSAQLFQLLYCNLLVRANDLMVISFMLVAHCCIYLEIILRKSKRDFAPLVGQIILCCSKFNLTVVDEC